MAISAHVDYFWIPDHPRIGTTARLLCQDNRGEFEPCRLYLSGEGNGEIHRSGCHLAH